MLGFLSRFVDSNDRELKRIQPFVDDTNDLEPEIEALSDGEIRERFAALRTHAQEEAAPRAPGRGGGARGGPGRGRPPPPGPGPPPRARRGPPQAGDRRPPGRAR